MMLDMELWFIALLLSTGFVAGIINTLAGGGSNLTLPALMVMGMPPDVANATNRVAVFLQGVAGSTGFYRNDRLPRHDIKAIVIPTLVGSIFGSLLASYAPPGLLKYMLLGAMLTMTVVMLVKPSVVAPPPDTVPFLVRERPSSIPILLLAGFYGGFVQAGVGFILIAAFAGSLRYDLVRSNALKMFTTLFFTAIALAIFIYNDQVLWIPGLTLSIGTVLGAYGAVKFAIKAKPSTLKWFLFVMTLTGCIAAIFSDL